MQAPISCIKLMFAVAGGVVIGGITLWLCSLLLAFGIFSVVTAGLNFTVNEPPKSAVTRSKQYQNALSQERQQESFEAKQRRERQRAKSAQGRQLLARCDEWATNYKATPTRTTKLNRDFHCGRYSRFIETGYASQAKAPVLETR